MNCEGGSVGNILGNVGVAGNMALAKLSQASLDKLQELSRQYAHAKQRIGNIRIYDPCEVKFTFISDIASTLDRMRFDARKLQRVVPLADETKERLARMDTEAQELRGDFDDALDDLADAVRDMLGAVERMDLPSSGRRSRSQTRSRSRSRSRERKGTPHGRQSEPQSCQYRHARPGRRSMKQGLQGSRSKSPVGQEITPLRAWNMSSELRSQLYAKCTHPKLTHLWNGL